MSRMFAPVAGAMLLVGTMLMIAAQPEAAIDLHYHWAASAGILIMFAVIGARLPTWLHGQLLTTAALLLSCIALYWTWQGGLSTWNFAVGLLPTSDAGGYFSDAQMILAGSPISDFSSRRPLFAAFLAGVLNIAGNDLRTALLMINLIIMATLIP